MHSQLIPVRIDKVLCLRLPLQGDVRVTLAVSRDSASIIFVFYTSYRRILSHIMRRPNSTPRSLWISLGVLANPRMMSYSCHGNQHLVAMKGLCVEVERLIIMDNGAYSIIIAAIKRMMFYAVLTKIYRGFIINNYLILMGNIKFLFYFI